MKDAIGILCGGGYISSFQAGIHGIAKEAEKNRILPIGFIDGYKGLHKGVYSELESEKIDPSKPGSVIGTSRAKADLEKIADTYSRLNYNGINLLGLVVLGGNDHLGEAAKIENAVGWAKTMDNDLSKTFFTLGYHTAASNAATAVRQGFYAAWTSNAIHVISMFGRAADWVVAAAAGWGSADVVVGGESPYAIEQIFEKAAEAYKKNGEKYKRNFAVIAVAEGASIKGLEIHPNTKFDEHGNPKLKPEQLELDIWDQFDRLSGEKIKTTTDVLKYRALLNTLPTDLDMKLSIAAGERCVQEILNGNYGVAAVVSNDLSITTAPLPEVSVQRFLRPEGFIDYESMQVTQKFLNYYRPIFGEPLPMEKF